MITKSVRRITRVVCLQFALGAATFYTSHSYAQAEPGTYEIHSFTFSGSGYVQAFAIETANSLVVIDAGATPLHAKKMLDLSMETKKPVAHVLITHGHVDHYAGAYNIVDDLNKIVTTKGVARQIEKYDVINYDRFGAPAPTGNRIPAHLVQDGDTLMVDGVSFTAFDAGPGESYADVWYLVQGSNRKAAFVGDIIMYGIHPFMQSGRSAGWLGSLESLKNNIPDGALLYLGHDVEGASTDDAGRKKSIIDWQISRVVDFRTAVFKRTAGLRLLTEDEIQSIVSELNAKAPENLQRYNFLISTSANVLAAEFIEDHQKNLFEAKLKSILTRGRKS